MDSDDGSGDFGIDVYVGGPDEPQPDWRTVLPEDDGDDHPATSEELAAMSAIAGVDYETLDWDGQGETGDEQ